MGKMDWPHDGKTGSPLRPSPIIVWLGQLEGTSVKRVCWQSCWQEVDSVNSIALSVFTAQILLGRVIGLAAAITIYFAFFSNGFDMALLVISLMCMVPPAATLGLLFAGQRLRASYVALLSTFPCTALFLVTIIPLIASPGLYIGWVERVVSTLPFLYTAITLARVGVGVRVTAGEQGQARQLRAAQYAATLAIGTTEEQRTPPAVLPQQ
jgi:hypothetical protein